MIAPPAATPPAEPTPTPAAGTPPPDPTAPPPAPPAIAPDGTLSENWFLALGDGYAEHAADLGKFKNLQDLITERDYFRKNGVVYPDGDDISAEQVERWKTVAKVPADAKGYGLTPESMGIPAEQFDAELADTVASAALAAHAPPGVVTKIVAAFNEVLAKRVAEAADAQKKQQGAAQNELIQKWGSDFQANASTVRHLTNRLGETAGVSQEDAARLANDPAFAKLMLEVSRQTREDGTRMPAMAGDLRSPQQRLDDIRSGTDPVWGKKYLSGTEEEKMQAYEVIKRLTEAAKA